VTQSFNSCTDANKNLSPQLSSDQSITDSIVLDDQVRLCDKHFRDDSFEFYKNQIDTHKLSIFNVMFLYHQLTNAKRSFTSNQEIALKYQALNALLNHAKKRKDLHYQSIALKYLGRLHQYEKEYDSAYIYLLRSAKIALDAEDSIVAANNFYHLSNLKLKMEDSIASLKFLQDAIRIHKKQKKKHNLVRDYFEYAIKMAEFREIDSSFRYLEKTKQYSSSYKGNFNYRYHFTKGFIFYSFANYDSSFFHFKKSFNSLDNLKKKKSMGAENSLRFILFSLHKGARHQEMKSYLDSLDKYAGNSVAIQNSKANFKYWFHKYAGNYNEALKHLEKASNLEDTLKKHERFANVEKFEKKIKLLEEQEKLKLAEQEKSFLKKQRWLWVGLTFLVLLIPIIYLNQRSKKKKKEYQAKLAEMQMASLKSQMNPHFMFNSINSIKGLIINDAAVAAADQLTKFSKLMRSILNYSGEEEISLEEELEFIQLYTDLETYKTNRNIELEIGVDENIDSQNIKLLPFLIQPFIENCFKHAFDAKSKNPKVSLNVKESGKFLIVIIEDNGLGMKESSSSEHESKGTQLVKKRLLLHNGEGNNIEWDFKGKNKGTRVTLRIKK